MRREKEINPFLTRLATQSKLSASSQQALAALLFCCRHVLACAVGEFGDVIRAKKPVRLPIVMTREEVKPVLSQLRGNRLLAAALMHGSALRDPESSGVGRGRSGTEQAGKLSYVPTLVCEPSPGKWLRHSNDPR